MRFSGAQPDARVAGRGRVRHFSAIAFRDFGSPPSKLPTDVARRNTAPVRVRCPVVRWRRSRTGWTLGCGAGSSRSVGDRTGVHLLPGLEEEGGSMAMAPTRRGRARFRLAGLFRHRSLTRGTGGVVSRVCARRFGGRCGCPRSRVTGLFCPSRWLVARDQSLLSRRRPAQIGTVLSCARNGELLPFCEKHYGLFESLEVQAYTANCGARLRATQR